MKAKLIIICATLLGLLLFATPAMPHHSFMAEFDMNKSTVVKGVLTDVAWANPHIAFSIDVTDEYGSVTHWGINAGAPSALQARGLTRPLLKPGDVIVVEGYPARNGKAFAAASMVTLPDGRRFFIGSDGAVPH